MVVSNASDAAPHGRNLWLGLHFPLLPVEVFSRGSPDRPVIVTEHRQVRYVNQAGLDAGIRIGSNMETACTLCADMVSFERNEDREAASLRQLARWAYQFTPCVVLREPHSLLLEIRGCLQLFGGQDQLLSGIRQGLDEQGYSSRMGINPTPLGALCLAEADPAETDDNSGMSLEAVAIRHLRIDRKIVESLEQMGIRDVGNLLALPTDGLNRRFGVFLTDYLQRLTGERPDPQEFITEEPVFSNDITFLSDVTSLQALVFPMKRLLGELCQFLRGRQLHTSHFTFRLSHRNHEATSFRVRLASPDNHAGRFMMLSQLQLEKAGSIPEVDNLRLDADTFFPARTISGDLFHDIHFHDEGTRKRSHDLIDMFHARLGTQSCFGLSLANDHRPERAWQMVRLSTIQRSQEGSRLPDGCDEENPRPLFLLGTPRRLETDHHIPLLDGRLDLLQGPERIDFGWWDSDEPARDYYLARHPCGALYWVYRQKSNWYLHGLFS